MHSPLQDGTLNFHKSTRVIETKYVNFFRQSEPANTHNLMCISCSIRCRYVDLGDRETKDATDLRIPGCERHKTASFQPWHNVRDGGAPSPTVRVNCLPLTFRARHTGREE
ncbi:unnamed protein product, partial [Ectocarpus fasciculatus]